MQLWDYNAIELIKGRIKELEKYRDIDEGEVDSSVKGAIWGAKKTLALNEQLLEIATRTREEIQGYD